MKLSIHMQGDYAGELTVDKGRFQFTYAEAYASHGRIPLSCRMPLSLSAYEDAACFPFFENLLPDGEARVLAADAVEIDPQSIHRLLARFGGDVAGAVTINLIGATSDAMAVQPKALTSLELARRLAQLPSHLSLQAEVAGQRLSLAGAMAKLPVLKRENRFYLPGSEPSTHIIKPEPENFPGLAANEYLCMRLARRVGLNVAEVDLDVSELGLPYLLVRRYDRDGEGQRLHQEDFCQVLGMVSTLKYQEDGGPTAASLFAALARHSKQAAKDLPELFLRMVFNLLVGNADAHAKNFSLLHLPQQTQLAPLYDVVCTAHYANLKSRLAMDFGDAEHFDTVSKSSFNLAAEDANINLVALKPRVLRLIENTRLGVAQEASEISQKQPRYRLLMQKLQQLIHSRCEKLNELLIT